MDTSKPVHKNVRAARIVRDFQNQVAECSSLNEISPMLSDAIQKTIGVSGIVVVPFCQADQYSRPDVIVCSDIFPTEDAAQSVVAALPLIDKELGPFADILSRDVRTYCLEKYFGNQFLEKTETYNRLCRPLQAEQQITAMMGTEKVPVGLLCLIRSAKETHFSDRDVAFTESIRKSMEGALFDIARATDGPSLHSIILSGLAARVSGKCAVLDAAGQIIWLNQAAERALTGHVFSIANCHYVCGENRVIALWREVIRRMALEKMDFLKVADGMTAERLKAGGPHRLYLIIDNVVMPEVHAALDSVGLTMREKQIAKMAAEGYTPLNIASIADISVGTVRNHLKSIYRKLNISSRMELALHYKP